MMFVFNLAESCINDDAKYEKWLELFKNMDEETKQLIHDNEEVSMACLDKLIDLAKRNKLNIYFQNVICMA